MNVVEMSKLAKAKFLEFGYNNPMESNILEVSYRWDLTTMFQDSVDWELEFTSIEDIYPQYASFQGTLTESGSNLLQYLEFDNSYCKRFDKLRLYSKLRLLQDPHDGEAQQQQAKLDGLWRKIAQVASFEESEKAAITATKWNILMQQEPKLKLWELIFSQYQSKVTQSLSPDAEAVFLSAMDVIWTTNRNYWNILDDEIDYGEITTFDNLNTVKITPSNFSRLFRHPIRAERQKVQKQFFGALAQFKESFSNFLTTEIRKRIFWAQNRGYKSSLAAALEKDGLDLDLFYNCMNTFDNNISYWHKYFELLSKKMNLNKLEAFDVRSPWFEQKVDIPYHTGVEWIIESLRVISDEYASVAKRALLEENWIDVSFDLEKTSIPAAYQCYSDHPRISINYQNDIQSVSLLAHELGHALHFYYSSKNQPYHLAVPKTFVTEIVANFHQSLLRKYILKVIKNIDLHKCLLEEELSVFYNYYFYMPLVGKLEEKLHNLVENGNRLNAKIISKLTKEIFEVAYGNFVNTNEYTGYIWMSCDMLHKNFYAFQYLTGLAGAQKIENFIESENQEVLKNYMYFIGAGCSENQIDLLKKVGVDFSTPEPIIAGFQTLSSRIDLIKGFLE